mgnify:FL=1
MSDFMDVGDLEWSDQLKQGAEIERTQRQIDIINNPAKLVCGDIKEGHRVVRRWNGERDKHAKLTNKAYLKATLHTALRN